ncbi:MAG TPA: RsmE family RNA methyltransferase [Thermoanaerobaculia bacterium]
MKHRIFVDAIAPSIDVTGEEFHHAVHVVRLQEEEEIEVFDGRGRAAHGRVTSIGRDSLHVDIDREIGSRESPLRIHLAAAIIQLDKFELVLQKATELGVASIVPLVTDRIELRPERYRGKAGRWEKIVLEAVKQSGRAIVPRVAEPASFDDLAGRSGVKLIFDGDAEPGVAPRDVSEVTILIGPEGGWSEREIAVAGESGCVFQRLGPRRLRAETASICAVSIVSARLGDL